MASEPRFSILAARWMMFGEWRAHPARALAAIVTIAVGVALGFAVHLINQSALAAFGRAVATVNGDADLGVHAVSPRGFGEALYPKLAMLDGIADASPVVEIPARIGPKGTALTLLGLDPLRASVVTPSLAPKIMVRDTAAGLAGDTLFATDAVFLSEAALVAAGKRPGDTVMLDVGDRAFSFFIAGTLPGVEPDQNLAAVDIAAAQWRFGQLGRLQRVDLKLKDGADENAVRARLAVLLPADAEAASAETEARRTDALSRAYRVNLDLLALMALVTGAFLVYSAETLSVVRRRPQFALLRVLGVTRGALLAQVLSEGAIIGFVGGVAGIGLGAGLAEMALRFLGGDLGGGYFRGGHAAFVFTPLPALVFFSLGVAAALIGSFVPARAVATAEPAVALKNMGDAIAPGARPKALLPALLLGGGLVAAFLPAVGGLPVFGYLAIALMLAGGVSAMPLLARLLLSPLERGQLKWPSLDLAVKRLWGAPSHAGIALSGIVASTALTIAMAVMVLSFRQSVDDWLARILPADVYLHLEGEGDGFPPALQRQMAEADGVGRIQFRKLVSLSLSPEQPPVTLIAQPIDHADPAKGLPLIGPVRAAPPGALPVWLSEPAAGLYRRRPGDWMDLPLGVQGTHVFVAGIWRDYGRQQGAIAMDGADYTRIAGDDLRNDGWLDIAPGRSTGAVIESVRALLPTALQSRVVFASARDIRARSLVVFDRTFAVTYLIEAVAILVGFAGVAATFSAMTLARAKEFGMLRHIGVKRGQIARMLVWEGALLGAVGVVAGMALGLDISQVLIDVVNPQSFHWTMETRIPFGIFAGIALALIAASCGTVLIAGRHALAKDAVLAVKEDW